MLTTLRPHSDLATKQERLAGQELINFVNGNPDMTHRERCVGAGYLKELSDGSKGCDFTSFFEAILDAKKQWGPQPYVQSGADWYDELTDQDRELYDMIEDICPEFTKLDAEQCQEFMDELSEHGITTAEQFQDAYYYQSDSYDAEKLFAEYISTEFVRGGFPDYVVIDWQATWDSALRYDFFTIEFDGETYFFNNNF